MKQINFLRTGKIDIKKDSVGYFGAKYKPELEEIATKFRKNYAIMRHIGHRLDYNKHLEKYARKFLEKHNVSYEYIGPVKSIIRSIFF